MIVKEICKLVDVVPIDVKNKNTWEYGYNKDYNFIVISKDGTLGEIYEIDGLRVGLPKAPPLKEIEGYDKKNHDQVWKRKPMPDPLQSIESEEEYLEHGDVFINRWNDYIAEEYRRRKYGHWFMLNGKPKYVTGKNYMFIQWSKLEHTYYPDFRYPQWVLWLHWEGCIADSRSMGQCYLKNRRSGYSTMNCADNVEYATSHKSKLVGIISKTSDDAQTMFRDMVVPIFKHYPFFFKPVHEGSSNPVRQLAFAEPSKRITASNKTIKRSTRALNTVIRWYATALNSMDGKKVGKGSLDEISKFIKEVPFDKYYQIFRTCLIVGKKIIGKTMAGSTANSRDKGGEEFKTVYDNSKVESRNPTTGRTISGLYSLFIPAYYNTAGFFDRFGECILYDSEKGVEDEYGDVTHVGAISFLKAELKALENDSDKYNEQLRQFPFTEEDAFRDESEECYFDSLKIQDQLIYNESKVNVRTKESYLTRRGKLVWEQRFKSARWVNDKKGNILTSYVPDEMMNNWTEERGKQTPANDLYFSGGIDSYDISRPSHGTGSNGSMHIFAKNAFEPAANQFIFEYCDRPETSTKFYEECAKIAVFCGCKILIENAKPAILKQWKEWGLDNYIMRRPDRKMHEMTPNERILGGIPATESVIHNQAELIEQYVMNHCGIMRETGGNRDIGEMGNVYFNELLRDWLGYDHKKRTKYDRTVSSGHALMAANRMFLTNRRSSKNQGRFFPKKKT